MKANVYSVELCRHAKQFDALKDDWDTLAPHCIGYNFHHDWNWHAALSRHLSDHIQFLLIRHGGQLVAIFPVDASQSDSLLLPFCSQTDLTDIILHKDHCNAVMFWTLIESFKQMHPGWHELKLNCVPQSSGLVRLLEHSHLPVNFDDDGKRFFFHTRVPEDINHVSKKLRKNIQRQARSLKKTESPCTIREASVDEFLSVDKASWKGAAETHIESEPSYEAFYRELATRYQKESRLHLKALVAKQHVIAVQFGLLCNGVLNLLKIAYLPDYHRFAPGNQMLLNCITELAANTEQVNEVSLTTGPNWAYRWHPESETVFNIVVFNSTLKGRLAWLKYTLKDAIRPLKQKLYAWIAKQRD